MRVTRHYTAVSARPAADLGSRGGGSRSARVVLSTPGRCRAASSSSTTRSNASTPSARAAAVRQAATAAAHDAGIHGRPQAVGHRLAGQLARFDRLGQLGVPPQAGRGGDPGVHGVPQEGVGEVVAVGDGGEGDICN